MSEPITLTERERAVFGSMIEYVRERCKNWTAQDGKVSGNAVSRWMEDWLSKQPAESASPPRVPGASAHPHEEGGESGPGQPIDICERLANDAVGWHEWAIISKEQYDLITKESMAETAALEREAAAEIRRLRAEVERLGAERIEALKAAEDDGFRAGIEAAAKYHDEQAAEWHEYRQEPKARDYGKQHRADAAAIRALADAPAPDPLSVQTKVGYFVTGPGGRLVFVDTDTDPREIHDNGRPVYRAYAEIAARGGTKGG